MSAVLRTENLSRVFHHRIGWFRTNPQFAVKDVSFELKAGKTLAVMGSNGSGKSTLAALVGGALEPTSGHIYLDGSVLAYNDMRRRAQSIRMIFQDAEGSLNPNLTIGKQLHEVLRFNTKLTEKQCDDTISKTLKRVGLLNEHRTFYPYMLTNGQKQRACIARAIILNPKVLVSDEALATLDTSVRAQILNLLIDLQRELHISYIFITHSPEIAQHMADEVLVMKDGKVIEYGETQHVLNNPQERYTRKLLNAGPDLST
ncbi:MULTISPECIES: ATP-binding cassette domain-containing protein [Gammaproteobacteria]|uniref:ATP-binding cassette domain-containing protein n=1 Tax=Gammaproteobacteria TaxID=1236 RepID=UPI000DCFFD50|nr:MULTISPECIES: ATP-binding cassette domain-containing protein [Gammaproteobacteria]RTE87132.1 ATP-binding cassette domain-containing protein [Aliidiomarina sp. B3213]TCZ93080.1 ATP-binding cassette domain-containing protein [Lysobacter sp. N42]